MQTSSDLTTRATKAQGLPVTRRSYIALMDQIGDTNSMEAHEYGPKDTSDTPQQMRLPRFHCMCPVVIKLGAIDWMATDRSQDPRVALKLKPRANGKRSTIKHYMMVWTEAE